jgi:hypothetical protein
MPVMGLLWRMEHGLCKSELGTSLNSSRNGATNIMRSGELKKWRQQWRLSTAVRIEMVPEEIRYSGGDEEGSSLL